MDFTNLDSRTGAEAPSSMHIKHPGNGRETYGADGQPCLAYVKGTEAASYQSEIKALSSVKMEAKDGSDISKTFEIMHAEIVNKAQHLITGFSDNCLRDGKPMTAADAAWWLNLQLLGGDAKENERTFAMQTVNHAKKRANYLGNVSPA